MTHYNIGQQVLTADICIGIARVLAANPDIVIPETLAELCHKDSKSGAIGSILETGKTLLGDRGPSASHEEKARRSKLLINSGLDTN